MAWAANEVSHQDVQGLSVGGYDADKNGDDSIDIDEFKDFAKEKYGLDENAATLIFSRENMEENGLFDEGGLNEEQFADTNENLAAFKDISDEFELKGMDKEVAMMLVGDNDGKMSTENVQKLIDDKIIEVTDEGQMKFTEEGEKFNDYLHNDTDLFSKDIPEHYEDFKSGGNGDKSPVEELNLTNNEDLPGTFKREGYDGTYVSLGEERVFYSGDENGYDPQVFEDGEWRAPTPEEKQSADIITQRLAYAEHARDNENWLF